MIQKQIDAVWIEDSVISVTEVNNPDTYTISLDSANKDFYLVNDELSELTQLVEKNRKTTEVYQSRKELADELNEFRDKYLFEKWNFYQNEVEKSLNPLEKEKIENIKDALIFDPQTILTSNQIRKAKKTLSSIIKHHNGLIRQMLEETEDLSSNAIINISKTLSKKEKIVYFLLGLNLS